MKTRSSLFILLVFFFYLEGYCFSATKFFDPSENLVAPKGNGTIYYVDSKNGDDANDGRTEATAFKTIGKAVNRYGPLKAGDTVLIKAGLYRERISITQDGTASNRIVIGAYGDGEVIIDASPKISGWEIYKGSIYKAPCNFTPTAVVVDDVPYFPEWNSYDDIDKPGKWHYDNNTKTLYLWVSGNYNPETRDVIIVKDSAYEDGVKFESANYVTLYGVTVRGAGGHGISILGDYAKIEKCTTEFNGKAGINIFRYGNTLSTDAYIVKNNIYHNCLRNWPRGRYKWGGWPMGAVSNSTPNAHFIGNISHKNGGEGIGAYGGLGGTVIKDNMVYDNWSVNIYIDNQPNALVEGNFVFSHAPDPHDLYNNQDPTPEDNRCLRRLRPEGIMTADENYNLNPPANFRNAKIINNIIIGCRRGITHYAQASGSGIKDCIIANNTIIVPNAVGTGEHFIGMRISDNKGNNSNTIYENNIIYAMNSDTYLLWGPDSETGGITLKNNIWYHIGNTKPFHWKKTDYSYTQWKSISGQGNDSIYADPRISDINLSQTDSLFADNTLLPIDLSNPIFLKLLPNSPAIDKGLDLSNWGITSDFFETDRPVGNAIDIGASEYTGNSTVALLPPSGVTATPTNSSGSIDISWRAVIGAVGYNVYRTIVSGSDYKKMNNNLINGTDYMDGAIEPGITYYYVVTSVAPNGAESVYSDEVEAMPTESSSNQPPVISSISAMPNPANNPITLVTFSLHASDSDGDALNYVIDFGDGSSATGKVVSHNYSTKGVYTVKATVSDGHGHSVEKTIQVTVKDEEPATVTGVQVE